MMEIQSGGVRSLFLPLLALLVYLATAGWCFSGPNLGQEPQWLEWLVGIAGVPVILGFAVSIVGYFKFWKQTP